MYKELCDILRPFEEINPKFLSAIRKHLNNSLIQGGTREGNLFYDLLCIKCKEIKNKFMILTMTPANRQFVSALQTAAPDVEIINKPISDSTQFAMSYIIEQAVRNKNFGVDTIVQKIIDHTVVIRRSLALSEYLEAHKTYQILMGWTPSAPVQITYINRDAYNTIGAATAYYVKDKIEKVDKNLELRFINFGFNDEYVESSAYVRNFPSPEEFAPIESKEQFTKALFEDFNSRINKFSFLAGARIEKFNIKVFLSENHFEKLGEVDNRDSTGRGEYNNKVLFIKNQVPDKDKILIELLIGKIDGVVLSNYLLNEIKA